MTTKGNGTKYELPYQRPAERGRWEAIRLGIYNPSTQEILGRTCSSWAAIALFYTIFYAVLAAFFAICLMGMLHTIDKKEPYWTDKMSLIGTSPGLGFRPISHDVERDGSLIWYDAKNASNVEMWTERLEKFLTPYKNASVLPGQGRNQVVCSHYYPPRPDMVCAMNMDDDQQWGNCTRKHRYGYNASAPCVFVKLNKIYGWVPEYYNDTNDLPAEMPDELKEHIRTTTQRNTIWVSCEGENPADKENIGRKITMHPIHGIPGYFFPYLNQEGYLSPVVAIQFHRPARNVLINIECRAWAKNINYRRHASLREGSVHFELMVD